MLYAITNKTQSNRDWTIVLFGADAPDVYVRASMLRYFHGLHTQTSGFFFFTKGACSVILIMAISVNRCVEIKKVPLQWCNQLLQSMEEGHRKAKCVQL